MIRLIGDNPESHLGRWIAWRGDEGAEMVGDPARPDHEAVLREIWDEDVYRLDSFVGLTDRLVIDVGAHIGAFTVRAALAGAFVVAVEPWHEAAELLRTNLALNGLTEVVAVVEAALVPTDQRGFTAMGRIGDSGMGHVVASDEPGTIPAVTVADLMAFIEEWTGEEVAAAILKIDIEGGEFDLFADGTVSELLARSQVVTMETHPGPVGRVIERLLATHHVEAFGTPDTGGMIHATRY